MADKSVRSGKGGWTLFCPSCGLPTAASSTAGSPRRRHHDPSPLSPRMRSAVHPYQDRRAGLCEAIVRERPVLKRQSRPLWARHGGAARSTKTRWRVSGAAAQNDQRASGCAENSTQNVGLAVLGPLRELDEIGAPAVRFPRTATLSPSMSSGREVALRHAERQLRLGEDTEHAQLRNPLGPDRPPQKKTLAGGNPAADDGGPQLEER